MRARPWWLALCDIRRVSGGICLCVCVCACVRVRVRARVRATVVGLKLPCLWGKLQKVLFFQSVKRSCHVILRGRPGTL